ncbi:MAG: acyl-CoA dehydrogenase family protein [Acidimicrobiia bacterium]|nr:acyl-CoA dehydrogenase family protein [Acidimicrobiia bacterium]
MTLSPDEIRAELDQILPRRTPDMKMTTMGAGSDDLEDGRRYLAATVAGGWAVPAWPAGMGGRGADPEEAKTIGTVLREYAVPDLYAYAVGLGMVGPTVLAHGSPDQQQRWLHDIASGTEIWCQMFSEPEAGSDLANLAMRAERDGDEWVLNGQKVWTSRGLYAQWGLCLARTDPDIPKHRGLTMFGIRMDTPGIEVRPLAQMNGDRHFSEVFVTDARVPLDALIGDVGIGWNVAMTVLAHERALAGESRGGGDGAARNERVPRWIQELRPTGVLGDPLWRQRMMTVHTADESAKWTAARAAASRNPGPAGSGAKLRKVASYKGRAYTSSDAQGAAGMLSDSDGFIELVTAPSMSIRGGTDEIQRNIVGERVLGLPGEPRVDRDVPWSESRRGTR